MSDISIVPIAESHIQGFWEVIDAVSRERKFLLFQEAMPRESTEKFVRENIEKGHAQFVAVADGTVVGWCDILPYRRAGLTHCGHLGMGLLPAFRGRGVGARLLSTVMEAAFARGLTRIELQVFAANARAIRLYEKMGFRPEGRMVQAWRLGDWTDDILCMAVLRDSPRP